jgi:hypothetical protein
MSSPVVKIATKSAKVIAVLLITLFVLVWLLSPFVSQHYASKYLAEQKLVLAESTTIRYNPFASNLTIDDLVITSIKDANKPLVELKSLSVTLTLYRLLTDTVHLSKFDIDGLLLDIDLNDESPVIGGFVIASDDTKAVEKNTDSNEIENEASNYSVSLPYLSIKNAVFNIAVEESQQEFVINSLAIKNVIASAKAQQGEVSLEALVNKAILNLTLDAQLANNQGEIKSALTLTDLALAPLQPFLSAADIEKDELAMQGLVTINTKQIVSITKDSTKINLDEFELTTKDLNVVQQDKTVAMNIAPLSMENVFVELIPEQTPKITGTAKLNVNNIIAYQNEESQLLAKISALNIDEITLSTSLSLITANIVDVIIDQAVFAENTTDEFAPLAQFEQLAINNIEVSQQGLSIDTINLVGLAVDTILDKDKNIIGLLAEKDSGDIDEQADVVAQETVEKNTNEADSTNNQTVNDDTKPVFTLSLNQFSLVETNHINFTDQSTTPHYERSFNISKFNAGPFDNQKPQQDTNFKLEGGSNKYAHFDLSALAKPFSEKDFYQLKGAFKEVSLPSLSTYIADAIHHELKSGQLDVTLDITIDDTDIDGSALLHLRGVELGAANDHEADTVKSQTSVPFNVALGMLKDSDGNVELDIPLEGSTDDPSFGMRGFISLMIKQATMSAAKEYLMTTFVPYANVVTIAMSAGDYLLKVRFNDLDFPPKETELNADHNAFLAQFSALMKDKPDTQLTLCAIATPKDIDKPLGTEIVDKDEIKQLAELSTERLNAFKDHMVNKEKIASSRLLLCSPKVDFSEDAKPRITFTD